MVGLPKRWIRQLGYILSFLGLGLVLILLANKHNYINVDHLLPTYLAPSFFQPPSDLYIIDINIGSCLKFPSNPNCGLPKASSGKLGPLYDYGGWRRVDKDIGLGSSWTKKEYFSYKNVQSEVLDGRVVVEGPKRPEEAGKDKPKDDGKDKKQKNLKIEDEVIIDIAISNSDNDSKFKGNKDHIPQQVLEEFHSNRVFDQQEHDRLKGTSEKKQKREIATDRHKLDRNVYIPTSEELKQTGWVHKSNGIWLKYGKSSPNAITGIDILFGPDAVDPRPNWNLLKFPLLDTLAPNNKRPYLSIRRGPKQDYKRYSKPLQFKNGKFKILQVADLHFSTGVGKCLDPVPEDSKRGCQADPRTINFIEKVLDIENPDFVVLSGDQVFGLEAPDAETAIFKALNPFVQRKIPFAVTLGNHDDEGSLSRIESMAVSMNLPYSVAAMGPEEVDGVGNYAVNIEDPQSTSSAQSLVLYFLDTHKYSLNPKSTPGYDWIKQSQLNWLEREAAMFKEIAKGQNPLLSMAFFHIPLPEYRNTDNILVGQNPEGVTAPRYNTHTRTVLGSLGVTVASVGHDHCNDYCLQDVERKAKDEGSEEDENKIWLCYGGGVGEGGYGGYGGFVRRLRVYEINARDGEIKSWKRREDDPETVFDTQILVSEGEVTNGEVQ